MLDEKDWCKYKTLSSQDEKFQARKMDIISRNLEVASGIHSADGRTEHKKGSLQRTFAPRQFGTASRARKIEQREWTEKMEEESGGAWVTAVIPCGSTTVLNKDLDRTESLLEMEAVKDRYNRSMDVVVQLYNEKLHLEHQLRGGVGQVQGLVFPSAIGVEDAVATMTPLSDKEKYTGGNYLISKHLQSDIDR